MAGGCLFGVGSIESWPVSNSYQASSTESNTPLTAGQPAGQEQPNTPKASAGAPGWRMTVLRILTFLVVAALSIGIYLLRDKAQSLASLGYPGIFLLSILSNATVILPAPGLLFVFAMGAVFNPFGVALAAGAGSAIGELSGYLAGFSGQGMVERVELYDKLKNWMEVNKRWRDLAIVVLAIIPNPLFDLAGMASGTLRIPVSRFLFFCWIGKTIKMLLFAYAGASSLRFFGP
jgi:membrane protein YqaA with SNARE-associated domain